MSLIDALQKPNLYDHPVSAFEVIETHISWVLLTGEYVYKIKKPVDFGFLDFSSLEKRRYYCNEELRLNRRLAPDLYLGVVAIHGSETHPVLEGEGPVIEYAVRMRQFPQSAQLDRLLDTNGLDNAIMDKLASKVAHFHLSIDMATQDSEYGDIDHVRQPVLENFEQIRTSIKDEDVVPLIDKLEDWSQDKLRLLANIIRQRKAQGFVRECHGDMHLRNIALWDDDILIFDCIEFNPNLYWIDVMSEVAFLEMDLEDRGQESLARRFLNSYLAITGDYAGLAVLRFYKVYRAVVRAKVDALRAAQEQPASAAYARTLRDFQQYLELAERYTLPTAPCLLINHGLSGAGKSFATRRLLESFPAIQVRSDVERKRLFPVDRDNHQGGVEQGIYTAEATHRTYARLVDIARGLLTAGYSVIIDAANLKAQQRQLFIDLAGEMHIPALILAYTAPVETLQQRVEQRRRQGSDVSDATTTILQHQLENQEPLSSAELNQCIEIDTRDDIDIDKVVQQINASVTRYYENET